MGHETILDEGWNPSEDPEGPATTGLTMPDPHSPCNPVDRPNTGGNRHAPPHDYSDHADLNNYSVVLIHEIGFF